MLFFMMTACTNGSKTSGKPQKSPDVVVTEFFKLLADGGRLANQEAQKMIANKYGEIAPDVFRKWTRGYSPESKISVVETLQSKEKTKDGDLLALVKLKIETPSIFGDPFVSSSSINLILDEETNSWKIDFLAQTIDESEFRKVNMTAGLELEKDNLEGDKKEVKE